MDNIDNKIRAAIAAHEAAHHLEIRVGAAAVEHVAVMEGKPADLPISSTAGWPDRVKWAEGVLTFAPRCGSTKDGVNFCGEPIGHRVPLCYDGDRLRWKKSERLSACCNHTVAVPGCPVCGGVPPASEPAPRETPVCAVSDRMAEVTAESRERAATPGGFDGEPTTIGLPAGFEYDGKRIVETPAAPTCSVVAGCDKLATAKGGKACVDHSGMVPAAPTGTARDLTDAEVEECARAGWEAIPGDPNGVGWLHDGVDRPWWIRIARQALAGKFPADAVGSFDGAVLARAAAIRARDVAAPPPPPAEPRGEAQRLAALVAKWRKEATRIERDVIERDPSAGIPKRVGWLRAVADEVSVVLANPTSTVGAPCPDCREDCQPWCGPGVACGNKLARPTVTPAPAPQPVSGEVAVPDPSEWVPIGLYVRRVEEIDALRADNERLAREVEEANHMARGWKEACYVERNTVRNLRAVEDEAATLRARVAELEAEMVRAGHNSAASSREAHRLQARIDELEAERAALDAQLVAAVNAVPTSAAPARELPNSPTGREPEKERKHMRTITHHIIPQANTNRTVVATDEPDSNAGGACHVYELGYTSTAMDGAAAEERSHRLLTVRFQHGPIKESGDNGVSEAQLLAVLIDRYESFQAGPFASEYNETTLIALKTALDAQHQRTRDRVARDVEGRNQK